MILISKYLIPKGYTAMAIYPFLVLKTNSQKQNKLLVNHEKIHLRQQLELLIFPFYVWYILEFLFRLINYRNWVLAYKNISFEREAYHNQSDFGYLSKRPFWTFINYM